MSQHIRTAIRVTGTVQGVGFRPFVYALAVRLGLAGLVGNDAQGVFAEVEGPPGAVQEFLAATARALKLWIVGGTVPLKAGADGRVAAASLVYSSDGERVIA